MDGRLRASIACGAIPVAASLSIWLVWKATLSRGAILAGGLALWPCLILHAAGLAFFVASWRRRRRGAGVGPRSALGVRIALGLLLIGLPVEGVLAWTTFRDVTAIEVHVHNQSGTAVEDLLLSDGMAILERRDSLATGETWRTRVWAGGDGTLTISGLRAGRRIEGSDGYVSRYQSGKYEIVLGPDGTVHVRDLSHP